MSVVIAVSTLAADLALFIVPLVMAAIWHDERLRKRVAHGRLRIAAICLAFLGALPVYLAGPFGLAYAACNLSLIASETREPAAGLAYQAVGQALAPMPLAPLACLALAVLLFWVRLPLVARAAAIFVGLASASIFPLAIFASEMNHTASKVCALF